jgi:N-acetylmuramoyl-L-alanine amidase
MLFLSPKKRERKIRETILRGIYEDNLRMIGKHPGGLVSRVPFTKKMFLFFSIALMSILGNSNYLNTSIFSDWLSSRQETPMTASIIPQKSFNQERSIAPSDYRAFLSDKTIPLSRMFGLGVKTIMIDPGHGGSDPGAIGKFGTQEKDITLDIAKRLRERLKKYGNYTVIMTREDDATLPLNKRVELANSAKADIFISIHLNYLPSRPINIIETYYFGPPSDPNILKLAEKENAGSQYGMSEFKEMIEKLGETLKLQESKEFAASIQKNLYLSSKKHNGNIFNFGVKRAPFVVLLGVDVPSVLAEVSCLSNKEEEMKLNTESHRENIARYLEAGILDYLNKGEVKYEAKRQP